MADYNSTDYYQSRERREYDLADAALSPAIAKIHREMAEHYSLLIAETAPVSRGETREVAT